MNEEIHLTKKDFKLEWYSGTGAGGQKRNKVQACCRITHIESGITVNGTNSRSRVENQRTAFNALAKKVIAWYRKDDTARELATETIRNYHEPRNEVLDKISGFTQQYKDVVDKGNIQDMVDARRKTIGGEE